MRTPPLRPSAPDSPATEFRKEQSAAFKIFVQADGDREAPVSRTHIVVVAEAVKMSTDRGVVTGDDVAVEPRTSMKEALDRCQEHKALPNCSALTRPATSSNLRFRSTKFENWDSRQTTGSSSVRRSFLAQNS
jgi:hypothetical protein